MDARSHLLAEGLEYHPLAVDAGFALEGPGDDLHPEMGFPFRPGPGVTGMQVGFVDDFQVHGIQGPGQFCLDGLGNHYRLNVWTGNGPVKIENQSPKVPGVPLRAPSRRITLSGGGRGPIVTSMTGDMLHTVPAEEYTRTCEWPGCREPGQHRAPRSRQNLRSYRWFCLLHVRQYNKGWSYYEGMNEAEIEADVRLDTVWRRPSWRLGTVRFPSSPDGLDDPFGLLDDRVRETNPAWQSPEAKAMAVLDLSPPLTAPALKARYKKLVKRHHPDANGGDKACEERFKQISQAYETLMDSLAPRVA